DALRALRGGGADRLRLRAHGGRLVATALLGRRHGGRASARDDRAARPLLRGRPGRRRRGGGGLSGEHPPQPVHPGSGRADPAVQRWEDERRADRGDPRGGVAGLILRRPPYPGPSATRCRRARSWPPSATAAQWLTTALRRPFATNHASTFLKGLAIPE